MTVEQRVRRLEEWRQDEQRKAAERSMWLQLYLGNLVIALMVAGLVFLAASLG